MKFAYTARTDKGEVITDELEAASRELAITALRTQRYTPLSLKRKRANFFTGSISVSKRVKLSEKILFAKNLSGMLGAGLPISRALGILIKQTQNVYFKEVIKTLLQTIDEGKSLSEGLVLYPKIFSNLFVAMVRAGEESGSLPQVLIEVETTLQKTYALNRKIKSALMYPMIILSAIVLIAILMFIYVVPTLTKTFKQLGVQLPATTRFIIFLSDTVTNHLLLVVLAIGVVVAAIYLAFRVPALKRRTDWVLLRLPAIKTITVELNAARTARTLSSLLASGVNISRALSITTDVVQNHYYKAVLTRAVEAVERGQTLSSVFEEEQRLYPIMVGEMMSVGEETGRLGDMLSDIALFYENEVDAKTKDLSTIIEPVLMIFIGAAFGFFAVSMLSPMYSILDAIK
jgi:type IV pilus assembly protein PilC